MSTHSEVLEWFDVAEQLPDDDVTVLVSTRSADVWLGWHDDGHWYSVDAMELDDVFAWAHIPAGPEP